MIFVYPALMSGNIDRRYFPGLIKTMELYYLQHIVEAASSGVLTFYIIQRSNGTYSEIMLESNGLSGEYEPMSIMYEALDPNSPEMRALEKIKNEIAQLEAEIKKLYEELDSAQRVVDEILDRWGGMEPIPYTDPKNLPHRVRKNSVKEEDFTVWRENTNKIETLRSKIKAAESKLNNLQRQKASIDDKIVDAEVESEKEKGSGTKTHEATGAASVKIDNQTMMDLRPTTISIDVNVRVIKKNIIGMKSPSNQYEPKRSLPISVKIVPMVVKDFNNIYSVLVDDLYVNKYASIFRSGIRSFAAKAKTWFGGMLGKFIDAVSPADEVNVWKDILLNKKGFNDASSFRSGARGPKYQKYAAAIVIMSSDDIRHQEQNFFDDPKKMMKLFNMGWNSFGIVNDADQQLTFCSYYENGMCAKIPYAYLFHSLKAIDIFKEMEQLGGFTRRVIGNFKKTDMKRLAENINIQHEVNSKINLYYNEYMKIADREFKN